MNQFLSEIYEKYTKIVKSTNLIGFLNWLVFPLNLTDSQPLDIILLIFGKFVTLLVQKLKILGRKTDL